jgi:hypothetical protein
MYEAGIGYDSSISRMEEHSHQFLIKPQSLTHRVTNGMMRAPHTDPLYQPGPRGPGEHFDDRSYPPDLLERR